MIRLARYAVTRLARLALCSALGHDWEVLYSRHGTRWHYAAPPAVGVACRRCGDHPEWSAR